MKNYENFDGIDNFDIQRYNGLETEKVTHFFAPYHITLPLLITCFGITNPNPNYYIKRFPVRNFILEHIVLVVILSVSVLVGMNFCMEHDVGVGQLLGVISGIINTLAVLFPVSIFVGFPISAFCSIRIQKKGVNCIW